MITLILIGIVAITLMMLVGLLVQAFVQRETYDARVRTRRAQLVGSSSDADVHSLVRHDDYFARLGLMMLHIALSFVWTIAIGVAEVSSLSLLHWRLLWLIAFAALTVSVTLMMRQSVVAYRVNARLGKYRVMRTGEIAVITRETSAAEPVVPHHHA